VNEFEAFASLDAIEPHWRALEKEGSASPFQRFDFVASYAVHLTAASGAVPAPVLMRHEGRPVAILPLEKLRRSGITLMRGIGGKHASFHLPLATREGLAAIATDPAAVLRRAAEAAGGADVVMLASQPLEWDGVQNPLALPGSPDAASHAYETELPADAKAFIEARFSSDARKKLRKKRQALAKLGKVAMLRPSAPADIEATLQAFLAQKERRFAAQGIANPFADAATQAFLRAAAKPRPGEKPAIELMALTCGDRIVAVFGLAMGFSRASGMFTSFEDDPAIARSSPGDLLLHDIIGELVARGFKRFDLGVGEARYKNAVCSQALRLVDSVLPLTLYGRLAAAVLMTASRVKAAVKRDQRLLQAANRLRSAARLIC